MISTHRAKPTSLVFPTIQSIVLNFIFKFAVAELGYRSVPRYLPSLTKLALSWIHHR